jgi:hypothetical protein
MDRNEQPKAATTDARGIAAFQGLPGGRHDVIADRGGGWLSINVIPGRGGTSNLSFVWPDRPPLRVRALAGSMRAADAVPGSLEQPIIGLDLLQGISGKKIGNVAASVTGRFRFGDVAPGLYFLSLEPYPFRGGRTNVEGVIPVEVDPTAPSAELDLQLHWSDCGLHTVDMSQCVRPELHVNKVQGRISDGGRSPSWPSAVVLLNREQKPVASEQANNTGSFRLPDAPDGDYELLIENPVNNVFRAQVHLEAEAPARFLEVHLGGEFACTTAEAK